METIVKRVYNLLHGEGAFDQCGLFRLANGDRNELKLFTALMNDKAAITFASEGDGCKCTIAVHGGEYISHFKDIPFNESNRSKDEFEINNKIEWREPQHLGEFFYHSMLTKLEESLGELPTKDLKDVVSLFARDHFEQLTEAKTYKAAYELFERSFTFKDLFCSLVLNGRDLNDIVSKGLKYDAEIEAKRQEMEAERKKQAKELAEEREAMEKQMAAEKKAADDKIAALMAEAEQAKAKAEQANAVAAGHEAHRKEMKEVIREAVEKLKGLEYGAPAFSESYNVKHKPGTATGTLKDRLECHKSNFNGNQYVEFLRDALISGSESLITQTSRCSDLERNIIRLKESIKQKEKKLNETIEEKAREADEVRRLHDALTKLSARAESYLEARSRYVVRGIREKGLNDESQVKARFKRFDDHFGTQLRPEDESEDLEPLSDNSDEWKRHIRNTTPPAPTIAVVPSTVPAEPMVETVTAAVSSAPPAETAPTVKAATPTAVEHPASAKPSAKPPVPTTPKPIERPTKSDRKAYNYCGDAKWNKYPDDLKKKIVKLINDSKAKGKNDTEIESAIKSLIPK